MIFSNEKFYVRTENGEKMVSILVTSRPFRTMFSVKDNQASKMSDVVFGSRNFLVLNNNRKLINSKRITKKTLKYVLIYKFPVLSCRSTLLNLII